MAQELFSRMSFLFNNRIRDITSEVFDKVSSDELLLRFGRVEIDLGRVSPLFSDEEFAEQYRRVLEESLRGQIKRARNGEAGAETELVEAHEELSQLHLLEQYLLSGIIPWWVNQAESDAPRKILAGILQHEPQELKKLVEKLYTASRVRKRLVYNFEEEYLRKIIRLLMPGEAEFIFSYHEEVCVLQQEHQLVKAGETQFRKSLWLFIFDFLADRSGSHFNRKMFVVSTLQTLAQRYNLSFEEVLFYMAQALHVLSETEQKTIELTRILAEISDDHLYGLAFDARQHVSPRLKKISAGQQNENSGDILFFLANGYLPEAAFFMDREMLHARFLEMIAAQPARVRGFLQEYGKQQAVRKRIVYNLGEAATKGVIELVEPAGAGLIFDYADMTGRLQKQKNIVPSEEKKFKDSLWELILDFLFSDRGSVFNAKMFLESGIRSLAQHYNIEYRKLVAVLAQGIGEKNPAGANYTSLFYLLTEILRESGPGIAQPKEKSVVRKEELSGVNEVDKEIKENDNSSEALAYAVVHYWFEKGELPWWATARFDTFKEALHELTRINPSLAVDAFRRAFVSGKLSLAAFGAFHHEFRALVTLLPEGKKGLDAVQSIQNLFNEMDGPVAEKSRALLLMALTENLLMPGNDGFNKETSLHIFLTLLAEHLDEKALEKLMKGLRQAKLIGANKKTKAALKKETRTGIFSKTSAALLSNNEMISFLTTSQEESSDAANAAHKAAELIRYYLIHKNFQSHPGLEPRHFAEQLVAFLYLHDRAALVALFSSGNLSAQEQMELFLLATNERVPGLKQFALQHMERFLAENLAAKISSATAGQYPLQAIMQSPLEWQNNEPGRKLMRSLFAVQAIRVYAASRLSPEDFYSTVRSLGNNLLDELAREFVRFFSLVATDSFERDHFLKWIREFFLQLLSSSDNLSEAAAVKMRFLDFLYYEKQVSMKKLGQQFEKLLAGQAAAAAPARAWLSNLAPGLEVLQKLEKQKTELEEKARKLNEKRKTSIMNEDPTHEEANNKKPENDHSKKEDKELLNENEGIYIHNAGMILFHPFMPQLFSRAGLVENNRFKDEESRIRAAALLQYAVTGQEQTEEHAMPLNKILCGMDLQLPLGEVVKLTEEEKALATGMLQAVIANWDKMKNTSVAGLREAFLMREGRLMRNEEAWVLRVEHKTLDVLLQTLPWGLGLVKFQWMHLPLHIEWT